MRGVIRFYVFFWIMMNDLIVLLFYLKQRYGFKTIKNGLETVQEENKMIKRVLFLTQKRYKEFLFKDLFFIYSIFIIKLVWTY